MAALQTHGKLLGDKGVWERENLKVISIFPAALLLTKPDGARRVI
jgi:hypothetical protein